MGKHTTINACRGGLICGAPPDPPGMAVGRYAQHCPVAGFAGAARSVASTTGVAPVHFTGHLWHPLGQCGHLRPSCSLAGLTSQAGNGPKGSAAMWTLLPVGRSCSHQVRLGRNERPRVIADVTRIGLGFCLVDRPCGIGLSVRGLPGCPSGE